MSKGIYTKENVGNGVFIFTVNKNFVEPKFWGLHEENEQAQCVVIIHDGNALFFYPRDMDNDTHILLDWEKEQTGKIYPTIEEGMKDTDGIGYTKALAASESEIAEKVIALDLCGLSWHIPTLQESVLGYEHKVMLNAALAICGKQPVKDDWYWCSTRKENKCNFVLCWCNGYWSYSNQDYDNWVRPMSAISLNSL
jgi:hypothetical protein